LLRRGALAFLFWGFISGFYLFVVRALEPWLAFMTPTSVSIVASSSSSIESTSYNCYVKELLILLVSALWGRRNRKLCEDAQKCAPAHSRRFRAVVAALPRRQLWRAPARDRRSAGGLQTTRPLVSSRPGAVPSQSFDRSVTAVLHA
jgi:hypothetical protein